MFGLRGIFKLLVSLGVGLEMFLLFGFCLCGMGRKIGLSPVVDSRTRVLVLGSLPSDLSIEKQEYYGNKSNDFWRIVSFVFGVDLVKLDYSEKIEFLLSRGIGLWDVFESSEREGSMDKDMRENCLNDFSRLVELCPKLERVCFNGGLAFRSVEELEFFGCGVGWVAVGFVY